MKKGWLRNMFRGLCLTSAVFVFQACYGTPQDFGQDLHVNGVVKSKKTGEPIEGVMILAGANTTEETYRMSQYFETDKYGKFSFYIHEMDKMHVSFVDANVSDGKDYARKDTIITVNSSEIVLNIELEEKQ